MTSPGSLPLPDLRRAADARAAALARRFGDALRVGDGAAAERIVNDGLGAGMTPEAVQSLVIAPAMVRIGELWESRVIGIADEHLATSICHRALIRLFETLSAGPVPSRSRERVLLAAVEGQHHVLGLRMVADVLEGAGFDVLYLGEDVPVASLRGFLDRHRPAVAGLAFGIASDVGALADALHAIHDASAETRIMLGGRAVPPTLRATGYPIVADTVGLIDVVDQLLAAPPQPLPAAVDVLRSHQARQADRLEGVEDTDPIAETLAKAAEQAVGIAREHVRRAETYRAPTFRDQLTGLENRRAFEDALTALGEDSDRPSALLLIDLDAFRAINSEHGPQAGDRLLRSIGQAILGAAGPGDVVARVGGDEFAVLLPGATVALAAEVAARVRAAAAAGAAGPAGPAGLSIGIAAVSRDPRGALLAAGTALHEAKAAGGDRVVAASLRLDPSASPSRGSSSPSSPSSAFSPSAPSSASSPPSPPHPGRDPDPIAAGGEESRPMYVSMSRLAIPVGRAPELVAAFRGRSRLADQADGFLDLQVWQSDRDPGEIVMVSRWRDREAFKAYMRSADHKTSHDRIDPGLKEDISLRRLEHLHTYEVVSE